MFFLGVHSMKTNHQNTSPLFDYMSGSLPPWNFLLLILLAVFVAVIVFLGIGEGYILSSVAAFGSSHAGEFNLDPLLKEFLPKRMPLFFKLVADIYEIPFYHLLFGILFKGLIVIAYFFLAWKITGSTFASTIALLLIFGLLKFEIGAETILNLKLPFIPDSMEIRRWCYLSFRQASAPFIIIGSIFFLSRKFVFSSIFLALAVYCHPHNGIIFFVVLNIALLISFLSSKDRLADIVAFSKFAFPFLIIISPYMLTALSTFRDVEPIPFLKFWELTIKNEPGDASTLYSLKYMHPPYLLSFYLTLAAVFLHFLFKSDTPKIKFNNANSIRDGKDMLWTMMLAPWVLVSFGCLWELGMMNYLPDFLNDMIFPLHIRRASMVSTILYIPIFAMLIARIILVLSEKLGTEIIGEKFLISVRFYLDKINLKSLDHIFSLVLSIGILLVVILLKNEKIETFKKYWIFDPIGYELALSGKKFVSMNAIKMIPASSLIDVCDWIKNNTHAKAAFFHPVLFRPFRACTKRQGFIEEKLDGNIAIVDRRFANIYYSRFADIHRGLTYLDFPEKHVAALDLYPKMQERYLSLDGAYIEFLKEKYPGYRYFLTEKGHKLPYLLIFKNSHFLLYDLTQELTKTK
jgi:hypothetical protein